MSPVQDNQSVAIIGAGIIGIAVAYYLALRHGRRRITLIDQDQPMAFTSAQSGENYRNWWPHPSMVAFTNRSIDLMEDIARQTNNRINMTRRGYALATRAADISPLVDQLRDGLLEKADALLRFHGPSSTEMYRPFEGSDWKDAPDGVDILQDPALIQRHFRQFDPSIGAIIHIRRGGDISGQQLGAYMLEYLRSAGCMRMTGGRKRM